MSKAKILAGSIVALVVLVVGGTWVYINLIKEDAPPRLTLETVNSSSTAPASNANSGETTSPKVNSASVDGTWKATSESIVGYRVKEVLFGQSTEGVGRTNKVTGSMTIANNVVTEAAFEVDMASIKSDSDNRDNQFRGRIMDTATYPKSTFKLTKPITLGSSTSDGTELSTKATGDLTLKGTTKSVELDLTAKRNGSTISTLSNYEIVFKDWNINNPSGGPATTEDSGTLEIKLVFEQ